MTQAVEGDAGDPASDGAVPSEGTFGEDSAATRAPRGIHRRPLPHTAGFPHSDSAQARGSRRIRPRLPPEDSPGVPGRRDRRTTTRRRDRCAIPSSRRHGHTEGTGSPGVSGRGRRGHQGCGGSAHCAAGPALSLSASLPRSTGSRQVSLTTALRTARAGTATRLAGGDLVVSVVPICAVAGSSVVTGHPVQPISRDIVAIAHGSFRCPDPAPSRRPGPADSDPARCRLP